MSIITMRNNKQLLSVFKLKPKWHQFNKWQKTQLPLQQTKTDFCVGTEDNHRCMIHNSIPQYKNYKQVVRLWYCWYLQKWVWVMPSPQTSSLQHLSMNLED